MERRVAVGFSGIDQAGLAAEQGGGRRGVAAVGGGKDFPTTPQSRAAWVRRVSQQYALIESRAETLLDRYGTSAESLLASATHDTRKPLRSLPDYDLCEILHFATNESVVHLSDITHRRTTIALISSRKAMGGCGKLAFQNLFMHGSPRSIKVFTS